MAEEKKSIYDSLEAPDYMGDVDSTYNEVNNEVERQERQARLNSHAAILGDMARLWADSAHANSGGWGIKEREPMAVKANERWEKMRQGKAAMKGQYAKDRAAARQQQLAWNLKVAQGKAQEEQARLAAEQKAQAAVQAQLNKDREYALDVAKAAETARHNAAMEIRNTGGSGKTSFSPYILVDGEKVEFSPNEYGTAAIDAAYEEMLSLPGGEEYAVRVKNPGYGQSDIDPYPSQYKKRAAIERWNKAQRDAQEEQSRLVAEQKRLEESAERGEIEVVEIHPDNANAKLLGMEPGKIYERDGKYYRSAEGKKLGLTKEKKVGLQ